MIVIADDQGPEAIGGIMGGLASGCTEATVNVFLEAALFDPINTAKTGRKLGIQSDARYRNERGLDPQSEIWGIDVATRLILELCGGEVSEVTSAGTIPTALREIQFRPSRVLGLGGVEVATERQKQILLDLGFKVAEKDFDSWSVTVPTFRADVEGEADIVEEVMRVHGFDNIPAVSLPRATALPTVAVSLGQKRVQQAKRLLAVRGLNETVTFSFMPGNVAAMFAGSNPLVPLANPISADLDVMRPSILGNLLMAAARNAARGFNDLGIFEIGPTYLGETAKDQVLAATGIRVGTTPRHWQVKQRPLDAFDAKADAMALLSAFGVPVENLQIEALAPSHYHPGQSAVLRLGPTILAQFGALHPKVLQSLDVKGPAIGFEVFLERLPAPRSKGTGRPLLNASAFQPVERDFAFIVDAGIATEKLTKAAKGADKALITEVKLFDLFQGGSLPAAKKSVALSVVLQPREKTLTDAEIEAVSAKIVAAVNKATGGELRK
jgi:phenylalanyl-tRNA synthetase beta chain